MVHRSRLTHLNDRPQHGHTVKTDIMVREMRRTDERQAREHRPPTPSEPRPHPKEDPRNADAPTPEMVRERIRRTALVPAIVTVPCPDHGAAVGEPCYRLGDRATGVCGRRIENCAERVKARAAQR